MAIEWGAWENHIRVGIDVSWEAITHGEAAATATIKIYTDVDQTWSDTQTLNFGGSISGSTTFSNNQTSGSGAVLRDTKSYTYNYGASEYGSSPGSRTFSATLSGAYNGATPSKSVTSSIPKRPYDTPAAPTGVGVSRISDTSTKISWTNKDTAGEPWDLVRVQYDVAANDVWNGDIGTPSGGSTSFTWNGSVADNAYKFRVRAENSVGDSAYVETGVIYTTPNPPTSPTRSGTTTQSLSWANGGDSYIDYRTEVWRSLNGGAWTLLSTTTAKATTTATDTVSASDKVKYKFRHKTNGGAQGTLYSAFSAETSETVGVTSPPSAPTGLDPDNGVVVNPTLPKTLAWTHNPTDGSTQTAYQIQWRVVGAGSWTTRAKVSSSTQSESIAASTFTDNSNIEWQVKTWGAATTGGDGTGGSAWSASATFATSGDPNAYRENRRLVRLNLDTGGLETHPAGVLPPIGSMMRWGGEAAPAGWHLCDGATFDSALLPGLFTILGTNKYPYMPDEWIPDAAAYTTNPTTMASGWVFTSCSFQMMAGNLCAVTFNFTKNGTAVTLGNPDHTNQTVATWKTDAAGVKYSPARNMMLPTNDGFRHIALTTGGVVVTSGLNDNSYTNSNFDANEAAGIDGIYAVSPPTAAPRLRWIIKTDSA